MVLLPVCDIEQQCIYLFFVSGGSVYGDDNKVLDEVKPYSDNKSIIKKNHPLLIMVI